VVDITREKRLDMDEAAAFAKVSRQTIYALANRLRGKRLETAKLGGKRITTLEAIQRFLDQKDDRSAAPVLVPVGPPSDYEEASRLLKERHGF
jgi:transposase